MDDALKINHKSKWDEESGYHGRWVYRHLNGYYCKR